MDINNLDLKDIASWPKKVKIISVGIISAVLLLAAFFLLIMPQYSDLSRKEQQEVELKQQLLLLLPQLAAQRQQNQQLAIIKKLIEHHSNALPKADDLGNVLDKLNQLATSNQIDLLFLKPLPVQQQGLYGRIPIEVKATGDYAQIASFISHIAHLNYYLYISKMNLTLAAKNTSATEVKEAPQNNLAMEMTAEIYYFAPPPKEDKAGKKGVVHGTS